MIVRREEIDRDFEDHTFDSCGILGQGRQGCSGFVFNRVG
jgi:hypothetical protein